MSIMGSAGVGKSAITIQLTEHLFVEQYGRETVAVIDAVDRCHCVTLTFVVELYFFFDGMHAPIAATTRPLRAAGASCAR